MDALLKQSIELLGLPLIVPEPEVLQRDLERIRCTTLARIIADLIADNEPLFKATSDGATVTVRDCDGNAMRFTIQGSGGAVNASPSDMSDEPIDGREPRKNPRQPIFRDHDCGKCHNGELPCAERNYGCCSYPRARND